MNKLENLNCEAIVIAGMLLDKKLMFKAINALDDTCFYDAQNRCLFQAIKKCNAENVIIDTFELSQITKINTSEIEERYLSTTFTPSTYDSRIELLIELDKKRKLQTYIQGSLSTFGNDNFEDIVNNLSTKLIDLNQNKIGRDTRKICEKASEIADRIFTKEYSGSHKPMPIRRFKYLNSMINGLQKGRLYVLAGLSGYGKTAFALNMATDLARERNVYFNCLEMPVDSIEERIVADVCDIDSYAVQKRKINENHKQLVQDSISELSLFIDDDNNDDIDNFLCRFKSRHSVEPFDVIFLDYLNLFNDKSKKHDSEAYKVAEITRKLKTFAGECDIAIVLLAQFNATQKPTEHACSSNLKGSSSIKQDADVILLVDKERPSVNETPDMKLIIDKNRSGKKGSIRMTYQGNNLKFIEKEHQNAY